MMRKCQNCKYGVNDMMPVPDMPHQPVTVCQIVPPTVLATADGTVYHRSPTMQRGSWCGQHLLSLLKLWSNG